MKSKSQFDRCSGFRLENSGENSYLLLGGIVNEGAPEMIVRCRFTELMPVEALVALMHPRNPNDHSKAQIIRLAEIMAYQGVRHPIVISNLSGRMTKGHGRLESAIHNGWPTFPIERQDYDNEDQEYADIVADNEIARWSRLDMSKINLEVPKLGPGIDPKMFGFKNFQIEPMDKYFKNPSSESSEISCPGCGLVWTK